MWTVWEFWGQGDPFFGGNADDRRLGVAGRFVRSCDREEIARYVSRPAAELAASVASNRREGGLISIIEG